MRVRIPFINKDARRERMMKKLGNMAKMLEGGYTGPCSGKKEKARRLKRIAATAALFLLFASAAFAQSVPRHVLGTPLFVEADHDGVETLGYRFLVGPTPDSLTQLGPDRPVDQVRNASGLVRFQMPTLTRGTYYAVLEAYNADGATRSNTVQFQIVLPPPSAPVLRGLTVQVAVNEDGTLSFRLSSVDIR